MTIVLPAIGLGRAPNLVVQVIMVVLICLRGTVSRPETTKARWIHLLLKQIAVVCVMHVRVILQSLHQVLRVVQEITEARRAPLPLSRSARSAQILVVPLPVIWLSWLPSIGVQYIRLIATIVNQRSVGILLHLLSPCPVLMVLVHRPVPRMPVPLIAVCRRSTGWHYYWATRLLVPVRVVGELLLRV